MKITRESTSTARNLVGATTANELSSQISPLNKEELEDVLYTLLNSVEFDVKYLG